MSEHALHLNDRLIVEVLLVLPDVVINEYSRS